MASLACENSFPADLTTMVSLLLKLSPVEEVTLLMRRGYTCCAHNAPQWPMHKWPFHTTDKMSATMARNNRSSLLATSTDEICYGRAQQKTSATRPPNRQCLLNTRNNHPTDNVCSTSATTGQETRPEEVAPPVPVWLAGAATWWATYLPPRNGSTIKSDLRN